MVGEQGSGPKSRQEMSRPGPRAMGIGGVQIQEVLGGRLSQPGMYEYKLLNHHSEP